MSIVVTIFSEWEMLLVALMATGAFPIPEKIVPTPPIVGNIDE
jgi:hypothetical protein